MRVRAYLPTVAPAAPHEAATKARLSNNCDSGNGIRTRVPALRGLCPRPLDDTATENNAQAGRDSNPQPLVLETSALPVELPT